MNAHVAQIQALISEIDEVLVSPRPRLSWVMGDTAQRRILERIRSYLISLAEMLATEFAQQDQRHAQTPGNKNDESLVPMGSETTDVSLSTNAQQVWRSLVEEMSALQTSFVQPLHSEIDNLQHQRQALLEEVKHLEIKRQHLYSLAQQAAGQQQIISDFLQALMGRLEENISAQVRNSFTRLEAELFNQAYLPHRHQAVLEESSADDSTTPLLTPAERLKQLRMLQSRSDELLMTLDSTLNVVCDALQRNVQGYQESLARAVEKINRGSMPGDVMVATLVNRLAEKLGQEVSTYIHSTLEHPNTASVTTDVKQVPDLHSVGANSAMVSENIAEEETAIELPSSVESSAVDDVNLLFDFSVPPPETPVSETLALDNFSQIDQSSADVPFPYPGSEWPFASLDSFEPQTTESNPREPDGNVTAEPLEVPLVAESEISGSLREEEVPTELESLESAAEELDGISESLSSQPDTNLNELYESLIAAEERETTEVDVSALPQLNEFTLEPVTTNSVEEDLLTESLFAVFSEPPIEEAAAGGESLSAVDGLFTNESEMSDRTTSGEETTEFKTPESFSEALFNFPPNGQTSQESLTTSDFDIDQIDIDQSDNHVGAVYPPASDTQPIAIDNQLFYGLSPAFEPTQTDLFHGDAYIPASPDEDLLIRDELTSSSEASLEIDSTTLEQLNSDLSFLEDFEQLDFQAGEETLNFAQEPEFTLADWPDDHPSPALNDPSVRQTTIAEKTLAESLWLSDDGSDRIPASPPSTTDENDLFASLSLGAPTPEENEDTDFDWSILDTIDSDDPPELAPSETSNRATLDDIFASLAETSQPTETDDIQSLDWSEMETTEEGDASGSLDDLFSSFVESDTTSLEMDESDLDWLALDAIAPDSEHPQRN